MYTHEAFINKLKGYEGGVGGKRLRLALNWPKDVFDVIRNELKEAGLITVGKGQGGSIELVVTYLEGYLSKGLPDSPMGVWDQSDSLKDSRDQDFIEGMDKLKGENNGT